MPNSLTKGTVSEEIINRMVKKAFEEKALEMQELKEGYFNIAYKVRLKDRNVVLKIAPSPDIQIMTNEKNIMYSEVDSMRMVAKRTDVPIPRILFYDNSGSVIDREYFFMEMLQGQSLSSLQDALSEEEKQGIYYRLGQYTRQLNGIEGERFGYYAQPDRQGENWFEVFRDMVRDTYADARRKDIDMPVEEDKTLELLERDRAIFEAVKTPRFVHWDIWAGNVFIADNRIEGIIDFERCLWADALMEVGFRNYECNIAFYDGYGIEELTGEEKRRARWYDIYVALLWCLETDYRGYDNRDFYHMGCRAVQEGIEDLG
ncbi:MAG: aminoglycoside phosphotransferase family protein [Acetatifactor sp.]|nr:aminoglycoside phosphotransferase family protein [Acetatifactor sp.]